MRIVLIKFYDEILYHHVIAQLIRMKFPTFVMILYVGVNISYDQDLPLSLEMAKSEFYNGFFFLRNHHILMMDSL